MTASPLRTSKDTRFCERTRVVPLVASAGCAQTAGSANTRSVTQSATGASTIAVYGTIIALVEKGQA